MDRAVRDIVIVGGGTSGWLSAVMLTRGLNNTDGGGGCRVTLIESSDIGTIGVGEATIPSIRKTFAMCGFSEKDWMVNCNASFKMAIQFVNWGGLGQVYWHPFGPMPRVDGFELPHYWLRRRYAHADTAPMDESCFAVLRACEAKRAPRMGDEPEFEGLVPYAYHLDAGLLATYLKQRGIAEGVRHVVDNVVGVNRDERGYITGVRTEHHGEIGGEFFLDCSGFSGFLINKVMEEPFISYSDALFCDRAIAMPIPTDDAANGINPFTSATALSAGWVWHTPLFGRSGNGYVYSSAFTSPDEAEAEFRRHLGAPSDPIEARQLRMRVGRTRNSWVKNCLAIGLAGGFIEPLESTGIWFAEFGLYNLLLNFPDKTFNQAVIAKYNAVMRRHYEEIRDFIVLHYCTTQREDTEFWKANKNHGALPDSLREDMELWAVMFPNHEKLNDQRFYPNYSFSAILAGMGRLPDRALPFLNYREDDRADKAFESVRQEGAQLRNSLPDHYRYLAGLRGAVITEESADKLSICFA